MFVILVYDVGQKRVAKALKTCRKYLYWVQNSVFECVMDAAKAREVKAILEKIIDKNRDSLRFYNLGNNYKTKVEHIGAKPSFDLEGVLTL